MTKLNIKFTGTLILACIAGVVSFYITRGLNAGSEHSDQGSMKAWLAFTDEQCFPSAEMAQVEAVG